MTKKLVYTGEKRGCLYGFKIESINPEEAEILKKVSTYCFYSEEKNQIYGFASNGALSEIERAVARINKYYNSNSKEKNTENRYVELLKIAEEQGLNHGKAWTATDHDIDKYQLHPQYYGELICYVYSAKG